MNKLYKNKYVWETLLKNGDILIYKCNSNLKYGEPKEEIKVSTEWKDLLKQQNYIPEFEGNKNRKGHIWCHVDYLDKHYNRCQIKVYKDDFVSVKTYNQVSIFELNCFKMHYLVEQLQADEFIRLLKDYEINILEGYKNR